MSKAAYKARIALSKARLDADMREYARTVAHHTLPEVQEMMRRRFAANPDYVAELWREFRK